MLYSNMTECLIFVFVVVGMYNLILLTSSICLVDRYEETPALQNVYVTHLHKTSHKSPNIKFQKIAFYLKCQKSVFFVFYQNHIFWARFFQNICFLHYSARFFKYLWLF